MHMMHMDVIEGASPCRHPGGAATIVVCALTLLVGCGESNRAIDAPLAMGSSTTDPTSLAASVILPDALAVTTLPAIPPDLDGQVDLVLVRQPRLVAAKAAADRERAKASGAGYFPDPMLQVSPLGNMAQTAAGEVMLMASLSQRIPFPGKLDAATQAAVAGRGMADAVAEATAATVTADVRRAWWRRWEALRSQSVLDEQRAIIRHLQQVMEAKVGAGRGDQADLLRLDVELGSIAIQASALHAMATAAESRICSLMLYPSTTVLPPPPVELPPSITSAGELTAWQSLAAERSPAIHQAQALRAQADAGVRQARLDRYPDLTVGLTYNQVADSGLAPSANGQDQWWLTFGINLPIWAGRLDAASNAAAADRRRASAQEQDASTTVSDRITAVWAASTAAHEQLRLLDADILPAARQALSVIEGRYAASAASYQDLIEAWRRLLIQDLARVRTVAICGSTDADLLEACGLAVPPVRIVNEPAP